MYLSTCAGVTGEIRTYLVLDGEDVALQNIVNKEVAGNRQRRVVLPVIRITFIVPDLVCLQQQVMRCILTYEILNHAQFLSGKLARGIIHPVNTCICSSILDIDRLLPQRDSCTREIGKESILDTMNKIFGHLLVKMVVSSRALELTKITNIYAYLSSLGEITQHVVPTEQLSKRLVSLLDAPLPERCQFLLA